MHAPVVKKTVNITSRPTLQRLELAASYFRYRINPLDLSNDLDRYKVEGLGDTKVDREVVGGDASYILDSEPNKEQASRSPETIAECGGRTWRCHFLLLWTRSKFFAA